MRILLPILLIGFLAGVSGCNNKPFDGPTVDAFTGQLTRGGKPVSFSDGQEVTLKVFHEKGQSFGIPIQPDGTFKIGWMPIGTYSAILNQGPRKERGAPRKHNVPGGLVIEAGKTQYTIELGKDLGTLIASGRMMLANLHSRNIAMDPKPRPNHEAYIKVLRSMTPEQRLMKAFEMSAFTKRLFKEGLRRQFPDLSETEFHELYLKRLALCHNSNY